MNATFFQTKSLGDVPMPRCIDYMSSLEGLQPRNYHIDYVWWGDVVHTIFKSWPAEFIMRNIRIYSHFLSFLNTQMAEIDEIIPGGKQGHIHPAVSTMAADWCPGDDRSQGISSHGIDLVLPDHSCFSTRKTMHILNPIIYSLFLTVGIQLTFQSSSSKMIYVMYFMNSKYHDQGFAFDYLQAMSLYWPIEL